MEKGTKLTASDFDRLPEANPEAALLDTEGKGRNGGKALLYVFTCGPLKKGKILVRTDYKETQRDKAGNKPRRATNSIVTAGYVERHNLIQDRYKVLEGEVE